MKTLALFATLLVTMVFVGDGHNQTAVGQYGPSDSNTGVRSPAGQRWAVLVGVNEYAELEDLRYCVADVRALRDRLVASGFPEENVFLLVDDAPRQVDRPFRANIQQRIETVLKVAREDDLVVVAFSGHGLHIGGTSYFCPADASLDSPETTMVPVDFVYRQLEASTARQKLLLVDACRNDPRPPGSKDAAAHQRGLELLGKQLQEDRLPKRVAALSSAAPGQVSWEDDKLGHGVFMHYVLEGLSGKADEAGNRDGVVSLPELYHYAYTHTTRWALHNRPGRRNLQTPELTARSVGPLEDWHLTRRTGPREAPPPAIAPFGVQEAGRHQQAWAAYLDEPVEVTNSVGMTLRLIPPGEFMMGSPDSERDRDADEGPQHRVRITRPFYLAAQEVTVGQFRRFVEATGYRTDAERDGEGALGWNARQAEMEGPESKYTWRSPGFAQSDDHPAVNVSWNDAVAFCEWLSRREGRRYRLPTEAEWEYACRAGTTTRWHHGDDPEALAEVGNVADRTAREKFPDWTTIDARDGHVFTAPVGSYRPNAWGLHDLHGNVWEWCADWYASDAYGRADREDPRGPATGTLRVFRGGSWYSGAWGCRSTIRNHGAPDSREPYLGFRVVRVPPDE